MLAAVLADIPRTDGLLEMLQRPMFDCCRNRDMQYTTGAYPSQLPHGDQPAGLLYRPQPTDHGDQPRVRTAWRSSTVQRRSTHRDQSARGLVFALLNLPTPW